MFGVSDHIASCGSYCGEKGANPIAPKGSSRKIGGRDVWRVIRGAGKGGNRPEEERYFQVGSQLPPLEKAELVKFLEVNIDVFAWSIYDVPGIDPEFVCHQLNANPDATPRKQHPRRSSKEHADVVR